MLRQNVNLEDKSGKKLGRLSTFVPTNTFVQNFALLAFIKICR